ncbi:glycosyltransferase family 1 protein [uncultured Phascolarctobacterium sp.]|uniref:glycosyltransferase family 4 protein n=1 Tax=uncultured Phascolarctobacterium sp. TaxID=512296 RepID=UPI0025FDB909|nr:glycosyltransferase family 1 protein [uncultured Phascolarctobacterium sp.]
MRICVDLTSLADNFSGIERFALSITKELVKHKEHRWILLFKNSVHKEFKGCEVEKVVIKGGNKLIFNQVILPFKLAGIKADRYFFPAFPAPFFFFSKNAYNTIHDLSCWDCPGSNKKYIIWYFKIMYWKASLCNKKIITVSEFSKSRICSILRVKPENVCVVYNGISNQFNRDRLSENDKNNIKEKYNLPENYVLCLSTLEPRKNLRLLLDAYASLFDEGITEEIVLAGRRGWKIEDFLNGYSEKFLQHVHFTGFVDDEDLPAVYKLAKVFVFPSSYEGFGIPPLEALACGIPVISSDAASMPEILGHMAMYFKSGDLMALIEKVRSKKQIAKGIGIDNARLSAFKWSTQADNLLLRIINK